ncbi:MAG TPA: hypothetical protein VGO52_02700 [Hyphomonadaceae bacterium]|jgi:hypothetical protein|nr:hypothetical protein [Hyphomonadaceae bacterium]
MLHTSTQKLIQKICELTESSDIVWKEAAEGRCRFETEGYQLEVAEEPPLVRLLSPEGRELEKAEAVDLAIAWPGGDGTFATHVADMARRAHRVARGAEHAITRILSSLSAPPKKSFAPPEREPTSAAIEFDQSQPTARKPQQLSAGESAASIAALNADMVSQRRQPEPPPSPHTAPAPQPAPPPRPQTAIDSVFAAEASAPEAEPAIAAAEEELPLEDAPPARTEPTPVQAAPIQEAPVQATLGQPAPRASALPPVEDTKPAPTDAPPFAQAQLPRPSAPLAKPASNLFMTGFSAVSRPAPRPEPQPAPPPAPAAKAAPEPPAQPPTPAPQPEPPRAPEMAAPAKPPRTGQDIYKPW